MSVKKFNYYTVEVLPEKLDMELSECGDQGWELVTVGMVQKPLRGTMTYNPAIPQYEIKYLLIFKKQQP